MEYKKITVGAVIAGYLAGIVEMIYVFIVDFNDCTKNCKKAVINMIKDIPKESARQLVHNIETGASKFTGNGFKVEGASEKLYRHPMEFSEDAFLSFNEASNLSRKLLHQLTGIDPLSSRLKSLLKMNILAYTP